MTLALHGKSRKRQGLLGLLAVLAVVLAVTAGSTLRNGGTAEAATTANLIPTGNGYQENWGGGLSDINDDNSAGCGGDSDYIYEGLSTDRAMFNIDTSSVPPGSIITSVEVRVCYSDSSVSGINGTFRTVGRIDGSNTNGPEVSAGSSTTPQQLTHNIDIPNTLKTAATDLEVGVQKTDSDGSYLRVYSINAVVHYEPIEQLVTFTKLICGRHSDVPWNAGYTGGQPDDTGGHYTEHDTSFQRDETDPATDTPDNCVPGAGWTFNLGDSNGATNLGSATTTGSGSETITLNASQLAQATSPNQLWVHEVLQAPNEFGNLRCYTDILNSDNAEFIRIAPGDLGSETVHCIAYNVNPTEPSASKAAAGYTGGKAHWTITVNNPKPAAGTAFTITDTDVDLDGAAGGTCAGDLSAGLDCSIDPGGTLVLQVSRTVSQECQPTTASNTATVVRQMGAAPVPVPGTLSADVDIPADTDLCDKPSLTKTAAAYDSGSGTARWTITINNNVLDAADRIVVVDDPDTELAEAACGSSAGQTVSGLSCKVAAGATLSFQVQRKVDIDTCEGTTALNSAEAKLDGSHIPGSPTGDVSTNIPGDDDFCPSTVTVQKYYDNDDSGTINAGDSLVNGWGMSISCTNGFAADGTTGSNGDGTVVFNIGIGPYPVTCTVTEGTLALVAVIIGPQLQATLNNSGNATVQFLNNPTDLPPPPPPGGEGPIPGVNPQAPQPSEPEPQEPEPTEEPTAEPTAEPTEPAIEPQEPSPTPAPPVAGSGLESGPSSTGSLWLAALGLLAISAAAGALALARKR